jgi:hypothetical protein
MSEYSLSALHSARSRLLRWNATLRCAVPRDDAEVLVIELVSGEIERMAAKPAYATLTDLFCRTCGRKQEAFAAELCEDCKGLAMVREDDANCVPCCRCYGIGFVMKRIGEQ